MEMYIHKKRTFMVVSRGESRVTIADIRREGRQD